MTIPTANICFYFEGKKLCKRSWRFVPRAGDEVMLGGDAYLIKRVVWGIDSPETDGIQQYVNIEIGPWERN